MNLRRLSLFFILIVLWDSIDDQCVAFAQRASQGRMTPSATDDDDDFVPFAFVYRAQILASIRSARFTPVALEGVASLPTSPTADLLYLLMSLQL
jgi:hypothetical protein